MEGKMVCHSFFSSSAPFKLMIHMYVGGGMGDEGKK